MCGIVAYIGSRQAVGPLLTGLYKLEERGYDSAGIAVFFPESGLQVRKVAGRIDGLAHLLSGAPALRGSVGIAHTRWATHGKPSDGNAHPHTDCGGGIAVVHNGILENEGALRQALLARGHRFRSETDTEALAHLIEEACRENNSLRDAVSSALRGVQGTWGIVVLSESHPDEIVAARMGSPLLLGIGIEEEMFVASLPEAFGGAVRQVVDLKDGEVVSVRARNYEGAVGPRADLEADEHAAKGDFTHWMLKEIYEQPAAVRRALNYGGRCDMEGGTAHLGGLDRSGDTLRELQILRLIACGTASYAALWGRYLLGRFGGFRAVEADLASEALAENMGPGAGVLAISQSGETYDTIAAVREAKRQGATVLSIVNRVGRTLARETGCGIYNNAGPEKAVASTKVFVSQLTILVLLTLWFGRQRGRLSLSDGQQVLRGLERLPEQIEEVLRLRSAIQELVGRYKRYPNFFFLGRDLAHPIALEGALKLKEVSYLHAEGYAAGEIKHGPIALIDAEFPSVFVVPRIPGWEAALGNMREVEARGGPVIAVATDGMEEIAAVTKDILWIPRTHPWLAPILAVVPLQLLAYEMAVALGLDPDRPRNLAKSVTVG